MSDEDDDDNVIHSEPIFEEKYMGNRTEKEQSNGKYDSSDNSKEKYDRLNPYLENIIKQLQTDLDSYVPPDDIYHKLAEALSISGRGDSWSSQLIITTTKLRPLLQKKLGISWAELKRILDKIIKRVFQTENADAIDLKSDKWAPPTDKLGNPLSGSANVYKGMDKAGIAISFEEFSERMFIKYQDTDKVMDEDELNTFILRTMISKFGFEARDEHIRRMLQLKCFEPENRFNQRQAFFDLFEAQHGESYDTHWLDDCVYYRLKILPIIAMQRAVSLSDISSCYIFQGLIYRAGQRSLAGREAINPPLPKSLLAIPTARLAITE
jgi:hypothetical protein